jgi:bile acid-coenzyme A ligase
VNGTTFLAKLVQLADADPDRPALTCGDGTLSRAELVGRVKGLAALFASRGVVEGSTVAICLPNSIGLVESLFAVWAVGGVPMAISDRLPALERFAIIELAEPCLVVGAPSSGAPEIPTLESLPHDLPNGSFTPGVSPVWKISASGGSTGRPKLIAADAPALYENVAAFAALAQLQPDGSMVVTGPISHNAPFVSAAVGALFGNHVVVMPRFDPADTLYLIERWQATSTVLVPTMMLRIWRLPEALRSGADVSSLGTMLHTGAPCPAWLKHAWIDWLGPDRVLEIYGGTELQAMTFINGTQWLAHPGSVGRVVIGEIEIRDPDNQMLPPGEEGEIWMRRGPEALPVYHYIGAEPRSAAEGWESLGDIGYLDPEGYLYITDRQADMMVVGGANVYPAEIEAALDEHPAVSSCCVVGLPDEDLGSVPHAIVELFQPVSDEELQAHLRERLAPYKLPRAIERVDTPLRDDAGKVRRSALRAERIAKSPNPPSAL